MKISTMITLAALCIYASPTIAQSSCFPQHRGDKDWNAFTDKLRPFCENTTDQNNGIWGTGIISMGAGTKHMVQIENSYRHCSVKDTWLDPESGIGFTNKIGRALANGDNSFRFSADIDNTKFTPKCRMAMAKELCDALGQHCQYKSLIGSSSGAGGTSESARPSNLDTPERLQAAQANQQQADRAFAGKRRAHDDNANSEQPTPGPSEGKTTNRGPVRVNVAYCFDSHKRGYSGSLKCSAQRFGFTSVETGQTVEMLPPNSGLQALTFACKHPTKPYDVEFANDGLSGRCAAY